MKAQIENLHNERNGEGNVYITTTSIVMCAVRMGSRVYGGVGHRLGSVFKLCRLNPTVQKHVKGSVS